MSAGAVQGGASFSVCFSGLFSFSDSTQWSHRAVCLVHFCSLHSSLFQTLQTEICRLPDIFTQMTTVSSHVQTRALNFYSKLAPLQFLHFQLMTTPFFQLLKPQKPGSQQNKIERQGLHVTFLLCTERRRKQWWLKKNLLFSFLG